MIIGQNAESQVDIAADTEILYFLNVESNLNNF
jgi:hypothetical protein